MCEFCRYDECSADVTPEPKNLKDVVVEIPDGSGGGEPIKQESPERETPTTPTSGTPTQQEREDFAVLKKRIKELKQIRDECKDPVRLWLLLCSLQNHLCQNADSSGRLSVALPDWAIALLMTFASSLFL